MREYEIIQGLKFEVKKMDKRNLYGFLREVREKAYRTIYDCYSRPSITKMNIDASWQAFFNVNDIKYAGVWSYNLHMFTYTGVYHDKEKKKSYLLYITKSKLIAYDLSVLHECL